MVTSVSQAPTTAPANTGLKGQWGVGDPSKPQSNPSPDGKNPTTVDKGSDKQAQDFQAAFQKEQGVINDHLQYTSANAEASKHAALASRRDALYGAFQSALAKIDRTDPSKAQGAIDKVLGDARALAGEAATLRQEVEAAKTEWDGKQPQLDEAVTHIEELEAWGDAQSGALRGQADAVRTQANERRWKEASTACDALGSQLAPVYDEYLKQKAAKEQYEPALQSLQPRLQGVSVSEQQYTTLAPMQQELATAQTQMESSAQAKDFVQALTQVQDLSGKVDALEQARTEIDQKKQEYETALAALQPRLTEASVSDPAYVKLEPMQAEFAQAQTAMEAAVQAGDYEQAMTLLSDLTAKLDAFEQAKAEIDQKKQEYEAALAALQPRIDAVSVSDPAYTKLEPMLAEITAARQTMDTAAQAGDYDQALTLAQDLTAKLDAYEQAKAEIDAKKQEYETALAALQQRLADASVSDPLYTELEPMQAEFPQIQTAMEAAAQAGDYEQAMTLLNDLSSKLDAFEQAKADLDQKRKDDFTAAWTPVKTKLADALLTSNAFDSMAAQLKALKDGQAAVESAAGAGKYEDATKLIPDVETKVDAYLAAAKIKAEAVKKKADEITTQLDGASAATRGDVARAAAAGLGEEDIKALPTDVRNRLLSTMQEGGLTNDEKNACKNLYSQRALDPTFEKLDDKRREELIAKMKEDPEFKKARDNWNTLSEADRIAVMKKAADYQAAVYGIPPTEVEGYSPKNADGTARPQRNGEYSHSDGKLKINKETMQTRGFDAVLGTVVHENGHRYQHELVDKLNKTPPELKPGDPEYEQARTFELNGKYQVKPKVQRTDASTPNTGDEYYTQPKEAHSRETGEGLAEAGIGQ